MTINLNDQDNTNSNYCNNINNDQDNTDSNYSDNINNDKFSDRQMWKTIKDLTDNNRQKPPRHILINNKMTTSLNKIINCSNQFFKKFMR